MGKEVTFGDLTIREFPIIWGDNPSCTGAPITIGWKLLSTSKRNLELYEYTKNEKLQQQQRNGKNRSGQPSSSCRKIPVQKRSQILLDSGYTEKQIIKRALEVEETKRLREESAKDDSGNNNNIVGKFSKNIMIGMNKLTFGAVSAAASVGGGSSSKKQ